LTSFEKHLFLWVERIVDSQELGAFLSPFFFFTSFSQACFLFLSFLVDFFPSSSTRLFMVLFSASGTTHLRQGQLITAYTQKRRREFSLRLFFRRVGKAAIMASSALTGESLATWAAHERILQERVYVATIAEEFLLLLMLEEQMRRERLEQRFRHERTLIELSLAAAVTSPPSATELCNCAPLQARFQRLENDDPLPFDNIDQLTEEEVERIWRREKQRLQQKIISVSDRIRKLRK
jgi:hypothetical protein